MIVPQVGVGSGAVEVCVDVAWVGVGLLVVTVVVVLTRTTAGIAGEIIMISVVGLTSGTGPV